MPPDEKGRLDLLTEVNLNLDQGSPGAASRSGEKRRRLLLETAAAARPAAGGGAAATAGAPAWLHGCMAACDWTQRKHARRVLLYLGAGDDVRILQRDPRLS
eukprot:gene50373-33266_t